MTGASHRARNEEWTPYACVRDVAASWERYACIAEAMAMPALAGLIVHVAGPTDEGFRAIDVWTTQTAWEKFRSSQLESAMADLAGSPRAHSTFRDFRPRHIVVGADFGVATAASNQPQKEER
jgi:hypothetical protein